MKNELVQPFLEALLTDLKQAHKKWCSTCVDDAEEMWLEYPEFIDSLIPEIENILDLPISGFHILEAFYDTKDVKAIIEKHKNYNHINLRIDNYTMDGDPNFGIQKLLTLTYSLDGEIKTITVKEGNLLSV